jgi:hypothetical protein
MSPTLENVRGAIKDRIPVFARPAMFAFRADSGEPFGYGFISRLLTDPAKKLHPQLDPAGCEVIETLVFLLFADPYGLRVLFAPHHHMSRRPRTQIGRESSGHWCGDDGWITPPKVYEP